MTLNSLWYFNRNLKPQGPFSLQEIRQHISRGEIGPQDLIYNDHEKVWRSACEWKIFEAALFPATQGLDFVNQVSLDEAEWILLVPSGDGKVVQEGPFSVRELSEHVFRKRISIHQYVWKSGLSGWCQIKDRPEFQTAVNLKNP